MQVSRGIEGSVEVGIEDLIFDNWDIEEAVEVGVEELVVDSWGIEKVSSNKESDSKTEARSIHQVSRSYQGGRSFLNRSTRYRGGVEIVLRKMHEKLDR